MKYINLVVFFAFISVLINIVVIYLCKESDIGIDDFKGDNHKIHHRRISRLGGLSIFIPYIIYFLCFNNKFYSLYMLFGSLIFITGFYGDLTKELKPRLRLIIMFFLFLILLIFREKLIINDIGFGFDFPLAFAIPFTAFAFTGIVNAINISDGINGLASGIAIIFSFFMFLTARELKYVEMSYLSLALVGTITGFFIINFFWKGIFLGDGGAYFIGYLLGTISAFVYNFNSTAVSPWFFVVLLAYPITDTLFSMYRRFYRGDHVFGSDRFHLHTLLYKRCFRDNSKAAVFLIIVIFVFSYAGYSFKSNTPILISIYTVFFIIYVIGYKRLLPRMN
jgi:UDP-GlcNAc:undecaprenyl-phosphate GlcNAc-1-phosphate transferase